GTPPPPVIEIVDGQLTRRELGFEVAKDLGGEYSLAAGDQRHRAVVNGIWEVAYGVQVSGLYFFGSGVRRSTTYGGDLRNVGGTGISEQRLRPGGAVVPPHNIARGAIYLV